MPDRPADAAGTPVAGRSGPSQRRIAPRGLLSLR